MTVGEGPGVWVPFPDWENVRQAKGFLGCTAAEFLSWAENDSQENRARHRFYAALVATVVPEPEWEPTDDQIAEWLRSWEGHSGNVKIARSALKAARKVLGGGS